jgi:hypothetical protein
MSNTSKNPIICFYCHRALRFSPYLLPCDCRSKSSTVPLFQRMGFNVFLYVLLDDVVQGIYFRGWFKSMSLSLDYIHKCDSIPEEHPEGCRYWFTVAIDNKELCLYPVGPQILASLCKPLFFKPTFSKPYMSIASFLSSLTLWTLSSARPPATPNRPPPPA